MFLCKQNFLPVFWKCENKVVIYVYNIIDWVFITYAFTFEQTNKLLNVSKYSLTL